MAAGEKGKCDESLWCHGTDRLHAGLCVRGGERSEITMATQPPVYSPGDTPAEIPTPGNDPGVPGGPDETPPQGPDFDQPDEAPVELPPPD
ncbi:hypothetical protein GCM10017612_47980 [Novosphingobium resinovorum]|nr:hypothetical protein GCM10017612_47980 [Novosphingobium resinovorum]